MGNWLEMTKRGSLALVVGLVFTAAAAAPAAAQVPTQIKVNGDWGSYSYQGEGGKTCYILSMPTEKLPADRDHGDVYFMLAQHPGAPSSLEPQFMVGYAFKDNSNVILDIDGKQFSMFTRGKNAWLENAAEEQVVVESMRAGSNMSLSGESRRGTQTKYSYSLSGVTASLQDIEECR